jgi:FAD/FMN-containing dehydrogenase
MIHQITMTDDYERKQAAAIDQFQSLLSQGESISIKKNVKHIFKERDKAPNLDLRHFNQVISIDTDKNIATVEGMTTYYDLVDATLPFNLMPQAVPELRSITVGGAIAGLGGQSSSFRFGLVHEMVTSFDLLTGEGKVIHCSPTRNADLFYMLPNSYGSLGYVLHCNIKLNDVAPYVKVRFVRFSEADLFFDAMDKEVKAQDADFIEGASFSPAEYVLLLGQFTAKLAPGEKPLIPLYDPFFKQVRDPHVDGVSLGIKDYIWRWDPDAFWATEQKNLFGDILLNPLFRRTLGHALLRSDRLIKIGKYRNRLRKEGKASFIFQEEKRKEALIQDAAIPFATAAEFDAWLAGELQIYPLWYCPVKTTMPIGTYPLYKPGSEFVVDFGFYTSMDLEDDMDLYYHNRQIEKKLLELGGLKCLYSDTFYGRDQFWSIYDKEKYDRVKNKYDPQNTYLDLYQKVVNDPV